MKRQIKINCTKDELFYNYLAVTKPYHNLTPTLMEYGAIIMKMYSDYAKSISKDDLIFELLFSKIGKDKIRESLGIENKGTFNVNWAHLIKIGFLKRQGLGYVLDSKYCLKMGEDTFIELTYNLIEKDAG